MALRSALHNQREHISRPDIDQECPQIEKAAETGGLPVIRYFDGSDQTTGVRR
jgi:hypothetical protein